MATSKQLEKLQTQLDLLSRRLEHLNRQAEVTHRNKVMMVILHDVILAQSAQLGQT